MSAITSRDPAYNRNGVPLSWILEQERAAHRRLIGKMRAALKQWLELEAKLPRDFRRPEIKTLRKEIIELTDKVLA